MMKKITLLLAFLITSIGFSQNLLTNGDFENGTASWTGSPFTVVGGEAFFSTTNAGGNPWDTQLVQGSLQFENAKEYVLTFYARAAANRKITVAFQNVGIWSDQFRQDFDLTTTMTKFTATFNATSTNTNVQIGFLMAGIGSTAAIYYDDISLVIPAFDPTKDATLSDLKVDGTTVAGFAPGKLSYDIELTTGTTLVPTVVGTTTQSSPATAVTTAAASLPGASTVLVTAQDLSTTKTYTINFTVPVPPTAAAPKQPARAAADVVSVWSDEYTNVTPSGVETFGAATYTNYTVVNFEDTRRLTVPANGGGAQYLYLTGAPLNLTSFTHMHIDFYVEGAVAPGQEFQVFLHNWVAWPSGAGSTKLFKNFDVNAIGSGAWYSADIALNTFNDTPSSRDKISLVQIVVNGPAGGTPFGPVYIDNLYFHKNTTLSIKDYEIEGLMAYPNPSNSKWTISTKNQEIQAIEVFNVIGKRVLSVKPNALSAKVDASSLAPGIYIATITTAQGTSSRKLIKN